MSIRRAVVAFAAMLFAACAHAPSRRVPGANLTLPHSPADQLLAAMLSSCLAGRRIPPATASDSSRLARACAAVGLDSLRGHADTIGIPPRKAP